MMDKLFGNDGTDGKESAANRCGSMDIELLRDVTASACACLFRCFKLYFLCDRCLDAFDADVFRFEGYVFRPHIS